MADIPNEEELSIKDRIALWKSKESSKSDPSINRTGKKWQRDDEIEAERLALETERLALEAERLALTKIEDDKKFQLRKEIEAEQEEQKRIAAELKDKLELERKEVERLKKESENRDKIEKEKAAKIAKDEKDAADERFKKIEQQLAKSTEDSKKQAQIETEARIKLEKEVAEANFKINKEKEERDKLQKLNDLKLAEEKKLEETKQLSSGDIAVMTSLFLDCGLGEALSKKFGEKIVLSEKSSVASVRKMELLNDKGKLVSILNDIGMDEDDIELVQYFFTKPITPSSPQIVETKIEVKSPAPLLPSPSVSPLQSSSIANNDKSSLTVLIEIISNKSATKDSRLNSLKAIFNLSCSPANGSTMGNKDFGLANILLDLICDDKGSEMCKLSIRIFINLSVDLENRSYLGSSDLSLIKTISSIWNDMDDDFHLCSLKVIMNLSSSDNGIYLGSNECGLLAILRDVISKSKGEYLTLALKICINLSCTSETGHIMSSPELSLIPALVKSLTEETSKLFAGKVLLNLSTSDHGPYLGSSAVGLLSALRDIINGDKSELKTLALKTCINLSCANENRLYMSSNELQLIPALINNFTDDIYKVYSIKVIMNLSSGDNGIYLGSKECGLLAAICDVISKDKAEAQILGLKIAINISCISENRLYMSSPELALIPVLVSGLSEESVKLYSAKVLLNLSTSENGVYLGRHDIGLILILKELLNGDKSEIKTLALKILINLSCTNENQQYMTNEIYSILIDIMKNNDDNNSADLAGKIVANLSSCINII